MTMRARLVCVLCMASLATLHAQTAERPDPTLTPGVVRPLSTHQICTITWGKDARHVTEAMKREVAASYHLDRAKIVARDKGPCCEFDHKVPRELGGDDKVGNLWPQSWASAALKDAEENRYHTMVCAGEITLQQAQEYFRHWGEQ